MNEEWKDWTKTNLERGCAPEEVKSILQNNGFKNNEIKGAMGARYPGGSEKYSRSLSSRMGSGKSNNNAEDAENVDGKNLSDEEYKALTEIAITKHPDTVRYESDELQLYTLEGFLSSADCKALIRQIDANLRPSTITSGEDTYGVRTSSTCDLGLVPHQRIDKVDKKIAETLGINIAWSETIQGQKYEVSQEFKAHTDYFTPNTKEYAEFAADQGQRTWTFMIYLNDTPKGGETNFVNIDKAFSPKKGMAVIWNNLLADGSTNEATMHHGCPVIEGTKYIVTKWFRDKGEGDMYFKQ